MRRASASSNQYKHTNGQTDIPRWRKSAKCVLSAYQDDECHEDIPRTRKRRFREEMKEQIVAQVHKAVVSNDSTEESGPEGNRTYTKNEDTKNEMSALYTEQGHFCGWRDPINSKILSLIETEMKRDINKHSHFTDSRPQSLSFYEDEKIPEEL
nr:unnamed protein product [Callosobruchus chinensis]